MAKEKKEFRDGTSQRGRTLAALNPGSVSIDPRGTRELLLYAQRVAEKIRFFDETNIAVGNWGGFLNFSQDELAQIFRVLENPEGLSDHDPNLKRFRQPHFVLFLIFLKLLQHPQRQLNGLTKRHLDYYYKTVLQLKPKPGIPDRVHVLFELAPGIEDHLLKKETLLSAGKDNQGNDLSYALESDIVVNRTRVAEIRTIGVRKTNAGVQAIHCQNVLDKEKGSETVISPFKPFGTGEGESVLPVVPEGENQIGFVVVSPLLELKEGKRKITITLACESKEPYKDSLKKVRNKDSLPFDVWTSGKEQWHKLNRVKSSFLSDIRGPELETYGDDLWLVCSLRFPKTETITKGDILQFEDGFLYQVDGVKNRRDGYLLRSIGKKSPTNCVEYYSFYDLNNPWEISGKFIYHPDNKTIRADKYKFDFKNVNHYLKLPGGNVYRINQIIDEKNVEVNYSGIAFHGPGEKCKMSDDILLVSNKTYPKLELTSIVSRPGVVTFDDKDLNRLILWENGKVFRIIGIISESEVKIEEAGTTSILGEIKKYEAPAISFTNLQFQIELSENDPPITAPLNSELNSVPGQPAVKILLKQAGSEGEPFFYEPFRSLQVSKTEVAVEAKGLTNLKLRNELGVLDPKTPFEPFGPDPTLESGLTFFHDEIGSKKLDSLTLMLDWMGKPSDFSEYYESYFEKGKNPIRDNNCFKSQLSLFDNKTWKLIGGHRALFDLADHPVLEFASDGYKTIHIPREFSDDPLEMFRYFKLELKKQDFLHGKYPAAMNRIAFLNAKQLNEEEDPLDPPNPPYTPKVKSFTLDYSATAKIDFSEAGARQGEKNGSDLSLFQVLPFGFKPVLSREELLPPLNKEGYLHIGLEHLKPQQVISLLFQMVPGSNNSEQEVPKVSWDCLTSTGWKPLAEGGILSDSSHGLINTGIFRLMLPEKAVCDSPLMAKDLYWIRASVPDNASAIPDMVSIHAQAAEAKYFDSGKDMNHFSSALAKESITGLVDHDPAIGSVYQPYSSFKGRSAEGNEQFYTRVSERLRHKQRAITAWDYERLVLEAFPEIYKAKCLRSSELNVGGDAGAGVVLVVIPDTSNTAPFLPLEPKAPVQLLKEIETFLKSISSPFIKLSVRNPTYEQIKYRVRVSFKEGCDQGFYIKQLNEDLKRFLSPWAYEKAAEISFGNTIHDATVINFVKKRPYIDFVAKLKLIENKPGMDDVAITSGGMDTHNQGRVRSPAAILVSAQDHIITDETSGIGYMTIGQDFDIKHPGPVDNTIGFMKVGVGFKIV